MKIMELSKEKTPYFRNGVTMCLGIFDGLHLGHQVLLKEAKKLKLSVAIFDFEKMKSIKKDKNGFLLDPKAEKNAILERFGIDYVIKCDFDGFLKKMTPAQFVKDVLANMNVKTVLVGEDYRFGIDASGDTKELVKLCAAFKIGVSVRPLLMLGNRKVSTSFITNLIAKGNLKDANALLGYRYFMTGKVIKGLENGQKIGFPTANIAINKNKVCPKCGVYYVKVIAQGKEYNGMGNVGVHPSISKLAIPQVEVHLFEYTGNLYGKNITVMFIDYVRDEIKFDTVDLLVQQLKKDKTLIIEKYVYKR